MIGEISEIWVIISATKHPLLHEFLETFGGFRELSDSNKPDRVWYEFGTRGDQRRILRVFLLPQTITTSITAPYTYLVEIQVDHMDAIDEALVSAYPTEDDRQAAGIFRFAPDNIAQQIHITLDNTTIRYRRFAD